MSVNWTGRPMATWRHKQRTSRRWRTARGLSCRTDLDLMKWLRENNWPLTAYTFGCAAVVRNKESREMNGRATLVHLPQRHRWGRWRPWYGWESKVVHRLHQYHWDERRCAGDVELWSGCESKGVLAAQAISLRIRSNWRKNWSDVVAKARLWRHLNQQDTGATKFVNWTIHTYGLAQLKTSFITML